VKKLVSQRQLILILIISLVALKVLLLPSLLAKEIGRDAYIYVLIALLFDFFMLLIFLFLFNKNPDLSFYQILEKMFGCMIARIMMFALFLFFLMKCWGAFVTNYSYLNENLYTSLKWYTYCFPILIIVFFIARLKVNALARLVEFFAPIVIIGFLVSLLVGIRKADYTNLLPILENGFFGNFSIFFKYSFWFGDYLIFIVFFGNTKVEKKFNITISTTILIAIVLIALFFATIFSVFSYNSVSHTNSISDILQVLPSTADIGSFDWVLILVWDMALFLYFAIYILGAFYSFRQTFGKKYDLITTSAILIVVLILAIIVNFDIELSISLAKKYFWIFSLSIEYGIPILLFLFSPMIKRRDKADEIFMEK